MLLLALLACTPPADPGRWTLPPDAALPVDAAREAEVERLLAELTLEEKLDLLAGTSLIPQSTGWPTAGVPRLDVPGFRMTDGPRGVGLAPVATVFPVGVARAATWDPDLEENVMASIAREAAAAGKDTLLAPTLNLVTHPAWGRAQESYGEEPLLLGAMAAGGLRGAGYYILTTAKHFAVNNIEATRYEVNAQVDDRTLREVYLPHFRMAVREGGADWIMAAYNRVNGPYAAANPMLLTEILKGEWGFQGAVMTDWIWGLDDGVAGLNAGLDLEMPIPDKTIAVAAAVADGTIPMSRLDDAARRQLRLGLARAEHAAPDPAWQRAPEHFQIAREAARRGTVLLKNEALLPLDPAGTVAVVGLLADVANTGDRGSSNVPYADVVTPLAGLVARLGDAVTAVPTDTPDAGQLAAIAAADAAVVVVGLDWQDEGECITSANACDREVLTLDATQEGLIAAVVAANPATVVILEGGAAIVTEAWVDAVPAVMMAWYPGQEGGHALTELLLGDYSPSGHLPVVFPRSADQLPPFDPVSLSVRYAPLHGWRWMERAGEAPRFPFGHGLSYTEFALSDVVVEPSPDLVAPITVSVQVENVGDRAGATVVQVYLRPDAPSVERPDRVLGGFVALDLAAGASETAQVAVDPRWLAWWDGAWVVEPGTWTIEVGVSSTDIRATAALEIPAP
jgi:beta-glucosidase